MIKKTLEHKNISDKAYEMLLEMIIRGQFEPGERLREEQLAEDLGISRTPLRDAINRLTKDGLIFLEPRKGASVREFTIDEVMDVYDIRIVLEGLAARLSAKRIDVAKLKKIKQLLESRDTKDLIKADIQLHDLIIRSCRNDKLIEMVHSLRNFIQIFRIAGYACKERSIAAASDHLDILGAMEKRNGKLAEKLMQKHIEKAQRDVLEDFVKNKLPETGEL